MNKSELIVRIKQKSNLRSDQINKAVNIFFDDITAAILQNNRIEIRDFGTFSLRLRNARLGYNPQTGRKFFIEQRQLPHFKASSKLKAAMNEHKIR